ncbi:MAG TPA: tetratricopeptide repeat protein, partial [Polyangiaceae bacterium]|nr:tetratricopeptide repeat protein [Polyangiaceae bacterium]
QYVLDVGRGKLQSLADVWQTADEGIGQVDGWRHVYGARGIAPGDPLHSLAPAQNWNHVCADCHSTNVERRYDPIKDSYASQWSELSVGCEACHGPGSQHVAWARDPAQGQKALPARLERSAPWLPGERGSPQHHPRDDGELQSCAPCHSRRETLAEGSRSGARFLDHFEPELLRPGRYHADGQVEGEVYEWGSFSLSKMHTAGVRCSDCHEPHSGKLRAQGDGLCLTCHQAETFAGEKHSRHGPRDGAPGCVDCHMPRHVFMQVDARRDHSLRIPRPDQTLRFGTPNACTSCHGERSAAWADARLREWYPRYDQRPTFTEALWLERQGRRGALDALLALARDEAAPSLARATALEALGRHPGAASQAVLAEAARSQDALVALGAALGAGQFPAPVRYELLIPSLAHPLRAVRVAVARGLADAPLDELTVEARQALLAGWHEVDASFQVGATLPAVLVEKAAFELRRGQPDAARSALKQALVREPCLVAAWLNLAELARRSEDEEASRKAIDRALACDPNSAEAHYARGLASIRGERQSEARQQLQRAVELAPGDARFALGLSAALRSTDPRGARRLLERALEARQEDTGLVSALADCLAALGDSVGASRERTRLEELLGPRAAR